VLDGTASLPLDAFAIDRFGKIGEQASASTAAQKAA
jgi:hypothetical protein